MDNIIEKLGITPIDEWNGFTEKVIRNLEQQRNELLEGLIEDIDLLETIMEHTFGDAYIESIILNRRELIQRIDPKHRSWEEIKALIN